MFVVNFARFTQPSSDVSAVGTNITAETVDGAAVWRITFSDGKTQDVPKNQPATTGELALVAATVNDVPNAQVIIYGAPQSYMKLR